MPIYEYQSVIPAEACKRCREGFEIYQRINEEQLNTCPQCGNKVRKIISWCHAAVVDSGEEDKRIERQVKDYENSGMWSHAAELADTRSEKTKDQGLRLRALDNYKKAGYDSDTLAKHAKINND
jgi:putative FmdB family regulatory protein